MVLVFAIAQADDWLQAKAGGIGYSGIVIDAVAYLADSAEEGWTRVVAPDGTPVILGVGNETRKLKTPLPDTYDIAGNIVVATPGCGGGGSVGVFGIQGIESCGSARLLAEFVAKLPKGSPVALVTAYNTHGLCKEDVPAFAETVRQLGGSYNGTLGDRAGGKEWDHYKSAYVLIGGTGGTLGAEQFCDDVWTDSAAKCGTHNGAFVLPLTAVLPGCVGAVVI